MRISWIKCWIGLLFFAFLPSLSAAENPSDLTNLLAAIHSMRADFTQVVYDNRGKAIQQAYGRMMLQRPGKFRWEVIKPIPQTIIANETRLWIYDPDLEQVTIRALHQAAGETPALLLSHDNSTLEDDFTVKVIAKNSPEWNWFSLVPKKADNAFASVQIGFKNKQIAEMDLKDQLGHTTKIQFKNTQINIPLASTLFTFKAPPKVDVIDETRKR